MTTRERVIQNIAQSLDDFMKNDCYLIEQGVSERAITPRVAEAFEGVFGPDGGYDVDCEYNRAGLNQIKRGNNGGRVYPDIIVHRRGQQNDNLLAVELKKSKAGPNAILRDQKKLEGYVRGQLRYKYGLSVVLHVGTKPTYTCRLFDGKRWTPLSDSLTDVRGEVLTGGTCYRSYLGCGRRSKPLRRGR
jgi:hypothetical protein